MSLHNVHATGLVLGGTGLILRGPPGAGKSLLALALLEDWDRRGLAAKLVADDRIDLEATPKGLVMHAPKAIEGLIELRGRGIVHRPFVRRARLDLVVDLVEKTERMVEEDQLTTELFGIGLARAPVPRAAGIDRTHQLLLIHEALRALKPRRRAGKKTA